MSPRRAGNITALYPCRRCTFGMTKRQFFWTCTKSQNVHSESHHGVTRPPPPCFPSPGRILPSLFLSKAHDQMHSLRFIEFHCPLAMFPFHPPLLCSPGSPRSRSPFPCHHASLSWRFEGEKKNMHSLSKEAAMLRLLSCLKLAFGRKARPGSVRTGSQMVSPPPD